MQDYEILADETDWPQYYRFDYLFLKDQVESTPTSLNAPYTGYFNANGDKDYFVVEISSGNHSQFLLPDLFVLGDYNQPWLDPSSVRFDTMKQEAGTSCTASPPRRCATMPTVQDRGKRSPSPASQASSPPRASVWPIGAVSEKYSLVLNDGNRMPRDKE